MWGYTGGYGFRKFGTLDAEISFTKLESFLKLIDTTCMKLS